MESTSTTSTSTTTTVNEGKQKATAPDPVQKATAPAPVQKATAPAPDQKATAPAPDQPQKKEEFNVFTSPAAHSFFRQHNITVMVSNYKANSVINIGATNDERLSVDLSLFPHPMAMALSPRKDVQEVWIACQDHLVRLCDTFPKYCEETPNSQGGGPYTANFVPRILHAIGAQDVHGIYVDEISRPMFLSTAHGALCRLEPDEPEITTSVLWKPPFVSEIKAEDRAHFNGVCLVDGKPKYACCISESDALDGWRDHRESGGVIIDIESNEIVCRGLSMPHSPTMHKGELWVLNSGSGELGVVAEGKFEPRVFLPGFLRGLHFVGRFAIVGSSHDRHENRFSGLELGKKLEEKKTSSVCGVFVVDTTDFSIAHRVGFMGVDELYDLCVVPGCRARTVGLNDPDSKKFFQIALNRLE